MNFNFNEAVKAKESTGKRIEPGIKKATFNGIEFGTLTSQKTGDTYKMMSLKLDVEDHGEYTQNFFEPTSNERSEGQFGPQPSQLDHFLITVREILDAVDPNICKDIDEGKKSLSGKTFKEVVDKVKSFTDPYIGTEVEIKLIPQNNGFCSMPGYPARIDRNGNLGIATRIIGHNLVLSPSEMKRIEKAKEAKPTNMASNTPAADILGKMAENVEAAEEPQDDLPF